MTIKFERTTENGRRTRARILDDGRAQLSIRQPDGTTALDHLTREEKIELAHVLLHGADPAPVYALCEYTRSDADIEGTVVVELYTSKQTAEQHKDRRWGGGYVTKLTPRTKLREY